MMPDSLVIPRQARRLHARHDDPRLGPYTHVGQAICAAVELASDAEGLRLMLGTTLGDRFPVRVADHGRGEGFVAVMAMPSRP